MKLLISKILITQRQRLSVNEPHVTDLMISFNEVGQVCAITVAPKDLNDMHELVAGRHRLEAATRLGWKYIEATVSKTDDPITLQKQQYIEDCKRLDRTWQERCLALYDLHAMITMEKNAQGEKWSVREMAVFTGYEKTNVAAMQRVAADLRKEPRDEELWACKVWTEALNLILTREDYRLTEEIAKRSAATRVQGETSQYGDDEGERLNYGDTMGDVENGDTTIANTGEPVLKQDKLKRTAKILGVNAGLITDPSNTLQDYSLAFSLKIEIFPRGKQEFLGMLGCIKPGGFMLLCAQNADYHHIANAVRDLNLDPHEYFIPRFPLVWNKLELLPRISFPVTPNMEFILAIEKKDPDAPLVVNDSPESCIIDGFPDDSGSPLPLSVVSMLCRLFCKAGGDDKVLLFSSALALMVAKAGYTPVWFEPDQQKFNDTTTKLTEWYTSQGVEVVQ